VISQIIGKIKQAQQEAAVHAVAFAPSNDANIEYLYGQRVGYYAGLDRALQEIEKLLSDQDEKDNNL
jgi:hypothetical protein